MIGIEPEVDSNGVALNPFDTPSPIFGNGGLPFTDPADWANAVANGLFTMKDYAIAQFDDSKSISYIHTRLHSEELRRLGNREGPRSRRGRDVASPAERRRHHRSDREGLLPQLRRVGAEPRAHRHRRHAVGPCTKSSTRASGNSRFNRSLELNLQRSYSFKEDRGWASYTYDSPSPRLLRRRLPAQLFGHQLCRLPTS